MLISIDGACKRNGQSTCSSAGVAWIINEDGSMLYKATFETCSTSQRGEINGLLEALKYAANSPASEDITIITDSEYLYNTVTKDWCHTWRVAGWIGATGPVKNADMWEEVTRLLDVLGDRVYMEWTKGHILPYTPGNIKQAMLVDDTGIELYSRIKSVSERPCESANIAARFNKERLEHDKMIVPTDVAITWAVLNTVADCLASYIVRSLDELNV